MPRPAHGQWHAGPGCCEYRLRLWANTRAALSAYLLLRRRYTRGGGAGFRKV